MVKRLFLVLLLVMSLSLVVSAQDEPLQVMATTSILADIASNIGGDLVEVQSLVPLGADSHAFQPAPADAVRIAEADVLLVVGAGLENFLDPLIENTSEIEPLVVSNGVRMLAFGEHGHDDDHADDDHAEEMDGMGDMNMGGVSAAYMRITNNGSSDARLSAVSSNISSIAEIHETTIVDDVARMQEVEGGLMIPAGETVELRPAGLHVMLVDLTDQLAEGGRIALTLSFEDGQTTTLIVPVSEMGAETMSPVSLGDLVIEGAWARPTEVVMHMDDDDHSDEDHSDEAMDVMHDEDEAMHDDDEHMHEGVEYVGVLGVDADCGMHEDDHEAEADHEAEGDEHEHGACDPHVWTDPMNVKVWADNIAQAFADADPANAETYMANAEAYKAELDALNEEVTEILSVIPEERRVLVTNHEFLGYFAAHYDFEVVGAVIPGGTTLAETNPQDLAALVSTIQAEGVTAIFAEVSDPSMLAQSLADQVPDLQVISLYSESLSEADGLAATYLDYMRYNAQTIADALGG